MERKELIMLLEEKLWDNRTKKNKFQNRIEKYVRIQAAIKVLLNCGEDTLMRKTNAGDTGHYAINRPRWLVWPFGNCGKRQSQ